MDERDGDEQAPYVVVAWPQREDQSESSCLGGFMTILSPADDSATSKCIKCGAARFQGKVLSAVRMELTEDSL